MAIITGDLLTDPLAQSFISIIDADAYLAPEQRTAWDLGTNTAREAALVQASRWLVATYRLQSLDTPRLARIGHVAARLAAEIMESGLDLFAGTDTGQVLTGFRAGPYSETYAVGVKADAAGRAWPWLEPMLWGLVRPRGLGVGAFVV